MNENVLVDRRESSLSSAELRPFAIRLDNNRVIPGQLNAVMLDHRQLIERWL